MTICHRRSIRMPLKETFAKAGLPAEIEVYKGAHGWRNRVRQTGKLRGQHSRIATDNVAVSGTIRGIRVGHNDSAGTHFPTCWKRCGAGLPLKSAQAAWHGVKRMRNSAGLEGPATPLCASFSKPRLPFLIIVSLCDGSQD
jgi:hypothetical protein